MNLPLNTDLTGKVAVVTGAAGTLCSVFSKALAASGAKVALLGRTYANVQKLADEITAEGGTAKAYECNVLDIFSSTARAATTPARRPTRNITSRAIWTPTRRAFSIWTRRALPPSLTSTSWGF